MESLATMAAAPMAIELGGRTYLISPLTLCDYGEIELAIRAQRNDEKDLSPEEMSRWMSAGDGLAYVLWLSLRRRQPDMSLDECRKLVARESDPLRLERALDHVGGLPVGNVGGQARRTALCRAA
jgi:hypothetical protein